MTSGEKKNNKFKKWRLGLFPSKHRINTPDTSQSQSNSFRNVRNLVIDSGIHVNGDHNTVVRQDGQGDRLIDNDKMNLLVEHIIRGAAHDDSAREPPPRCHPNTRIKLIARITTWFDGKAQEELLLWITGPVGVGKSAIVQTFTEYLVKSKSLGASVFISRPNKRNRPQGIFITIAHQLATRIEDYRKFIVERLSLDSSLLYKGIEAQFTAFIVEPFVEKKIGAGGKRWGILLDGLDELDGEDAQCNIIQLISAFARKHPDAPLLWVIASRPESHISNTFDDDEVRASCWRQFLPIDSPEACKDVARFLRSSFQTTRKKYRGFVPSDWPSETDFLKLTAAATGLFVYAQIVMEFIGDPSNADPTSQLEVLIKIIDRSNAISKDENPFVHLDALYHEILSMVPSKLWPRAKQLLAFAIHAGHISGINDLDVRYGLNKSTLAASVLCTAFLSHKRDISNFSLNDHVDVWHGFQTLRGVSILFSMPYHAIYTCLAKCKSTLRIPEWKDAHERNLTFLHASFADYLKDSSRSKEFHVGNLEDVEKGVFSSLIDTWLKCSGDDVATASVQSSWKESCLAWDAESPSKKVERLQADLFHATVSFVGRMLYRIFEMPVEPILAAQLRKVNVIKLCHYFDEYDLLYFVLKLMDYPVKYDTIGLLQEVTLRTLELEHLDCNEMRPARLYLARTDMLSPKPSCKLHRPRSSAELKVFKSELESLQERFPKLKVVVIGAIPTARVAALVFPSRQESHCFDDATIYTIPYSE